jgi:hypothetical protein
MLALSDDPQSTKAWAIGARGEQRLGQQLDDLRGDGTYVLHDRRIRGTNGNIDHIVVGAAGVFAIDAKKYRDRPTLRVEGGLIRSRTEKLMVGTRDRTHLVAGVRRQVDRVRSALESAGHDGIAVAGILCFVDAEWPLFGGDFTIDHVRVAWPKKVASLVTRPGEVDVTRARAIYGALASSFPPA